MRSGKPYLWWHRWGSVASDENVPSLENTLFYLSLCIYLGITQKPWRWKHVPPKHQWPPTILHSVKTQKTSSDQHLPWRPENLKRNGDELVDIHCSHQPAAVSIGVLQCAIKNHILADWCIQCINLFDKSICEDITCLLNECLWQLHKPLICW
jgi:hypothetical protein